MWPTITQVQTALGPMPVNTYGLFIMLAFSGAFTWVHLRARQQGIDPDRMIGAYVCAAVFGMLGGRIMYAFTVDWQRTLAEPLTLVSSCAGFAVYGGIIGGAIGVGVFAQFAGIPKWKLADLAGPSVLVGEGIGRMACFFAGCCHGAIAPTPRNPIGLLGPFPGGQIWLAPNFPFVTLEFHGGVGRVHDVPLYPVQLWAVIWLLGLAAALTWYWPRRRFDGQIVALTLLLEPPLRFLFEAFRADERGYWFTWPVSDAALAWVPPGMVQAGQSLTAHQMGITSSQGLALIFVAGGATIYALRRNAGVVPVARVDLGEADLLEELA